MTYQSGTMTERYQLSRRGGERNEHCHICHVALSEGMEVGCTRALPANLYCGTCFTAVEQRERLYLSDEEEIGDEEEGYRLDFADPGSGSALRAATKRNPRNLPCPTCGTTNVLTPADRRKGYQCDSCADRAEGKCEW